MFSLIIPVGGLWFGTQRQCNYVHKTVTLEGTLAGLNADSGRSPWERWGLWGSQGLRPEVF